VTDASDPRRAQQDAAVETLLESIGVASAPRLRVWNKIDLLPETERGRLPSEGTDVLISARSGEGLDILRDRIAAAIPAAAPGQGRPDTDSGVDGPQSETYTSG
jgi:GTP-binding protein HflX